jgi:hypothetical protein
MASFSFEVHHACGELFFFLLVPRHSSGQAKRSKKDTDKRLHPVYRMVP